MRSLSEDLDPGLRAETEALIGRKVIEAVKVRGGANSRVYRIFDGLSYSALKLYPRDPADPRDRLGAEVTALQFLRRHGMRNVPGVLHADRERRIGVYEWIDGTPVAEPNDADVGAMCDLLGTLHRLRCTEPASAFPLAAEACLSARELGLQIERRYARLHQQADDHPALAAFLVEGVAPVFAEARGIAERQFAADHLDFAADLPLEQRSLSPSDFGFHNAMRRPDGSLAFCDFEYFGWDDPVKPVADFLLHPGMTMRESQRRAFAAGALSIYGAGGAYELRLRALFPLYGLRWCLILLNEYVPERWMRRKEAGALSDRSAVLAAQLDKARGLLQIAKASFRRFPHAE